MAGNASAWREAFGEDGYLRYRDDALVAQFTIPATLPVTEPIAAGIAVDALDMTQARLDSDPSTRTDWADGHWIGYEDSDGTATDLGGTDCNFVAFVAADPDAAAPSGDDACRTAVAAPPPAPTPAPGGSGGGGGGGGGAGLWLLPLLLVPPIVGRRRKWRG